MIPRPARAEDAEMLACIHVQAWHETYPGLLPAAEIAALSDPDRRRRQWQANLAEGSLRVRLVDELGFAVMGPQREAELEADWPEELWSLYLLRAGQGRGLGQALLAAVRGPLPFTLCVVEGNTRACRFYEASGGRLLLTRDETVGVTPIRERLYGFAV